MLGPEPIVISKSCSQPQAVAWHLDNASESVFHLTKEKLQEKQKKKQMGKKLHSFHATSTATANEIELFIAFI